MKKEDTTKGIAPSLSNRVSIAFDINKSRAYNDIARLASVDHRSTDYRRNGMLNFGANQLMALSGDLGFYTVGIGGSFIVGT